MNAVAKVLLFNAAGGILLLRRSATHPRFPHHLDFPGGEVETGEQAAQAVAREIREETSLTVPATSLKLVYEKMSPDGRPYLVFTGFAPSDTSPKITLSWEHEGFEWLTAAQLLAQPLLANVDQYYKTVLEYLKTLAS